MTDLRLSVIEEEPKTPDSPRSPEPIEDVVLEETNSVQGLGDEVRALLREHYGVMAMDVWPQPTVSTEELTFKIRGNKDGIIQEFTFKCKRINPHRKVGLYYLSFNFYSMFGNVVMKSLIQYYMYLASDIY